MPIFVSWSIWISRNSSIFLDNRPNFHICSMRSLNLFKEYENLVYKRITKNLFKPAEVPNWAIGFFDGASKLYNCGCGFVLNLSKYHFLYFGFGGGPRTNTKAKLLSLYGLLFIASLIGVSDIGIYGDSKIIIDWHNGISKLQVLSLSHWSNKIQLIKKSFASITFNHISRCFNATTDSLSKEALSYLFGFASIHEYMEGKKTFEGFFDLKKLIFTAKFEDVRL